MTNCQLVMPATTTTVLGSAAPAAIPLGGAFAVMQERVRQITDEGYAPEHDDPTDLAWKAYCLINLAAHPDYLDNPLPPAMWPGGVWKPPSTRRRALVIAAALIAAAIDALDEDDRQVTDEPPHSP
jgi:hypothetical protein